MKEHKKLYKSGKLWMTATVVALAAGTTMATTTVHADTAPVTNTTSEMQNGTQTTDQQKAALQKDIQEKQQQVNDKTSQATNLQNEIDGLNNQLSGENANYQQEQAQIKTDAADKQTSLDSKINTAQTQIDATQNNVKNTQTQISDTNAQITDLQNQQGTSVSTDPNIVKVPNGYIDTSKSLLENAARNNLFTDINLNNNNNNIIPSNIYVSPDSNKSQLPNGSNNGVDTSQTIYDPYFNDGMDVINGQMTENQKEELAILLMNIINNIREQRGLQPFIMTKQKFDQAQVRANQASATTLTHSVSDMVSAFGADQYENLGYIDAAGGSNMLSLLYNATGTISNMFNADASSNWGHRENFLEPGEGQNAAFGFKYLPEQNMYVMTFDFNGGRASDDTTPNMMDEISSYQAMGPTTPSTTTVDNTAKINQLKSQLTDLNNQLSTQKAAVTSLQNEIQDLNDQKSQISSDEQAQLSTSTTKHTAKVQELDKQISTRQTSLTQLKNDIQGLQTAIANDQTALDKLNQGGQTPVETKKDNEKYTSLDPSLVEAVHATAGDTSIPAPKLSDDAFITDTNHGTYPQGTTVEWADPTKVQNDAQTSASYNESVILTFPDGTKSAAFNVPGVLVVAAKQTPSTEPSTGDDTHTTEPTNPSQPTTPTDDHHEDTTPSTPADQNNAQKPADQLPAGAKIVNGKVVDVNGNVIAGWQAANGQAVKGSDAPVMTREAYRAQQQAKQLPQTGNTNSAAAMGLGIASLVGMLGLAGVNKKRG